MSACVGCQGVGSSNSAVDNFDLDSVEKDGNIFNVLEDSIVEVTRLL